MASGYSPVVLDAIIPDTFPEVDLYVKQQSSFALYKPHDTKLTPQNIERLQEGGTDYVYVKTANLDEVNDVLEKDLKVLMADPALSPMSRNLIFSHVVIACINDVFKNPGMAIAFHKCRTMLKVMDLVLEDRDELISLFEKLRVYEKYLVVHTAQTTILSMFLYEKLYGAKKSELVEIGLGAMLHDIGMLYISNNITEKTDTLTEAEYHRVKHHPRQSQEIIKKAGITEQVVLDMALDHHERHDGSGYPRGLHHDKIPRHSMVVNICDIYCALTMDRPYKTASTMEEALKTMKGEKKLFDPQIFEPFLDLMRHAPVPEPTQQEKNYQGDFGGATMISVDEYRRQMRAAGGDRNKLMKLHVQLTESLKEVYGEEKVAMTAFRQELREFMRSTAGMES